MEMEAVTHALRWIAIRGDSKTTHAVMLTDLMSLPQKWKWNGKPRLECVNGWHPHSKLQWVYCPGHAGVMGTNQAHRLASGLRLGKSEVLRSLRHYLRTQNRGHHTIDRLEGWGMERGSARRSSLKGWEMAIVNHMNTGTVSKAVFWKLLRERDGAYMGFSEHIDTILNWTVLLLLFLLLITVVVVFIFFFLFFFLSARGELCLLECILSLSSGCWGENDVHKSYGTNIW